MDSMTNTLGLTIAMAYTTITASFLSFTESVNVDGDEGVEGGDAYIRH